MVSKKFCEARCPIININAHFLEIGTQLSNTVPDFEILPNNWESRDSETVLTFKFCPIRSRNIDFTTSKSNRWRHLGDSLHMSVTRSRTRSRIRPMI